jgi:peptidoglycan hydrolase-like protein with peptidoglycan-binding domain
MKIFSNAHAAWRRLRFRAQLTLSILALVCSACTTGTKSDSLTDASEPSGSIGVSTEVERDDFVQATGEWELFKRELPPDDIHSDVTVINKEMIAVSLRNTSLFDEVICGDRPGLERARLTVRRYMDGKFQVVFDKGLLDLWVTDLRLVDVTNDSVQEVVVSHECSGARWAGKGVTAYRLGTSVSEWVEMPATGATSFEDEQFRYESLDCMPSCGETGTERYSIGWNGTSFEKLSPILEDGTAIDLAVTTTCIDYKIRKRLPLDVCDKGPLARKFIALARYGIGDYSESAAVSQSNDRITPDVARWIKTYRFRNSLEVSSRIDEELFARLGQSWYPSEDDSKALEIFDSYCAEEGAQYSCTRRAFLFPTNQCPTYRPAWEQELPLTLCDYGAWVGMLRDALGEYDGLSSDGGWVGAMFDAGLEQRVRRFQSDLGLEVDGLAGPATWGTLFGPGVEDMNGDGLYGPGDIIPH